jgi:nucleoside-diphosphate-sugar epimerase
MRDFLYIDDLVEGILRVGVTNNETPVLLNFSSGVGHTLLEVVQIACEVLGRPVSHRLTGLDAKDIPYSVLDVSVLRSLDYLTSEYGIEDGIKRTLLSYGL